MTETTNVRKSTTRKALLCIGSAVAAGALAFALFGRSAPQAGDALGAGGVDRSTESSNGPGVEHDSSAPSGDSGSSSVSASASKKSSSDSSHSSSAGASTPSGGGGSSGGSSSAASTGGSSTDIVDGAAEQVKGVVDDVASHLGESVDTVTDVVDEVADQLGLGDAVGSVTGTLDDAGTDLEAVTQDILDLVDQGVPLEDAVDQVLGLLPVPSLPPVLPSATPPGGLLGGLIGH